MGHLCHQAATAFHLNVGGAHVNTLCSFELGPQTQFPLKLPTENPLGQKSISEHDCFIGERRRNPFLVLTA